MKKLIYLEDAIDALEQVSRLYPYRVPGERDTYDTYNEAWNDAIGRAEIELEKLPPAFPCPEGFDPAHPTGQDKKDILEAMEWVKGKIEEDVRSGEPESEERPLTEDDYAYCAECDHVEMCRWYPMYGCKFRSRPSAEPERKTGRWMEITEGDCSGYDPVLAGYDDPVVGYVCSCCGDGHDKETMGEKLWNFCPNCGAKMEV